MLLIAGECIDVPPENAPRLNVRISVLSAWVGPFRGGFEMPKKRHAPERIITTRKE